MTGGIGRYRRPAVLLATRSADKLREIREILGASVPLLTLHDAGIPPDPAEDDLEVFPSFAENALAKARYFARRAGRPVLADDSGIAVPALQGKPGVMSKRFAETLGVHPPAGQRDAVNLGLLLRQADGLHGDDRAAYYVCACALVIPPSGRHPARERLFTGTVRGVLAREPAGDGGFGYDPIFFVPSLTRTFAQVDAATKHGLSHRARAFRALRTALDDALEAAPTSG